MKNKKPSVKRITNKRARFDYELGDSIMAGLVLTGAETKALRLGHGHLRGAYVTVRNNELWLLNATITGFNGVKLDETEQTRSRKLLLKSREIKGLLEAKKQGKSIIPTELLTQGRYIKIRISTGTGKKHYDKRESLKKRDQQRETNAAIKQHRDR
ncbi:MAG: SsrA-binding protein SmpB [Candidatus Saccharimonadales bacterium]